MENDPISSSSKFHNRSRFLRKIGIGPGRLIGYEGAVTQWFTEEDVRRLIEEAVTSWKAPPEATPRRQNMGFIVMNEIPSRIQAWEGQQFE